MAGGENLRIGDAERDEAIVLLREHMSAGRITAEEFDERMSAALTAKTRGELTVLFNDLPGRTPGDPYAAHTPAPVQPVMEQRHQFLAFRGVKATGWLLLELVT